MKVIETSLPGCVVIEPAVFGDARGVFFETWNAERFGEHGLPTRFVQSNVSTSVKGVLRGLHYQWPRPQGKLVSVLEGEVYDVAVDIRRGSATFGRWARTLPWRCNGYRKDTLWPEDAAITANAVRDGFRSCIRY